MMPTLLLMRHAKSSWSKPAQDDFERPLNERGQAAAPVIGATLAASGVEPGRILCSSAQRTRETLALMLPHFDHDLEVRLMRDLYGATATDLIDAAAAFGGSKQTLIIIGHTPSIQAAAVAHAAHGNPMLKRANAADFPTGAVAAIVFEGRDWSAVRETGGEITAFLRPRELMAGTGADPLGGASATD
jgi:phosphohistidine phosphatase